MKRDLVLLGAPSNIGVRPYDDGRARCLDQAPAALRELGLVRRLGAHDLGDVRSQPYRDFVRSPGRVRNESEVLAYARLLARSIEAAVAGGAFPLVLGGDCSLVLGALLGARSAAGGPLGLAYFDGHADFSSPAESRSGSAASMCLALAVGHGETELARLRNSGPLVEAQRVALVGRRDFDDSWYGHSALGRSDVLDLPFPVVRARGWKECCAAVLERLTAERSAGFWLHLDADVLDPAVMPAVDSPVADGPDLDELHSLLAPLAHHPLALGMEVTIYDPTLDPDRSAGERLAGFLERLLARRDG